MGPAAVLGGRVHGQRGPGKGPRGHGPGDPRDGGKVGPSGTKNFTKKSTIIFTTKEKFKMARNRNNSLR